MVAVTVTQRQMNLVGRWQLKARCINVMLSRVTISQSQWTQAVAARKRRSAKIRHIFALPLDQNFSD